MLRFLHTFPLCKCMQLIYIDNTTRIKIRGKGKQWRAERGEERDREKKKGETAQIFIYSSIILSSVIEKKIEIRPLLFSQHHHIFQFYRFNILEDLSMVRKRRMVVIRGWGHETNSWRGASDMGSTAWTLRTKSNKIHRKKEGWEG